MKLGSLCSGAGGLDMAVEQVFGAETVWHCETDKAASKVLAYRWPGVPNHGDIITIDWNTVEPVDIVCAGWPCQPWSKAGSQKGTKDARAIWPFIADAIRILRPRRVALENVPTVISSGEFARAADSLAANGFDFSWTCLRASDIGAPHQRERVFIVAQSDGPRLQGAAPALWGTDQRPIRSVESTTDTDGHRHGGRQNIGLVGRFHGKAQGEGLQRERARQVFNDRSHFWGKYGLAIEWWESITRPAPPPVQLNRNAKPRLNPAFSEWMMGWPDGWVTAVPGVTRNDQLRIIGNGVVPQQAVAALRWLLSIETVPV